MAVILLAGCLLGACAAPATDPILWSKGGEDLLWPPAPEVPRIKFLRTISGPEDFDKVSAGARFFRWVAGSPSQGLSLLSPYGITADGMGRIWVSDSGTQAVHVFDLAREKVTYFTRFGSQQLISPVGVAVDPRRELLYVSDSGLENVFVANFNGDLLGFRTPPEGYGRPAGMATDQEGRLFVVDVVKGVVDIFSAAGDFLGVINGDQLEGGGFNRPSNVSVDGLGRIFVTDSMNFRIGVFDPSGESLGTIGELGDGPGTFARPRGVAVDSLDHVFVADAAFDNIQVFDLAGRLLMALGGPGNGPGEFALPAGLFFDGNDRLYVSDAHNHRIQIFQFLTGAE